MSAKCHNRTHAAQQKDRSGVARGLNGTRIRWHLRAGGTIHSIKSGHGQSIETHRVTDGNNALAQREVGHATNRIAARLLFNTHLLRPAVFAS